MRPYVTKNIMAPTIRKGQNIWPVYRNPESPKVIWCGKKTTLREDFTVVEYFDLTATPAMVKKFSRFIDMNKQNPQNPFRLYMLKSPVNVGPKQNAIGFVARVR